MDKFSHTDQCLLADSATDTIETEKPRRSLILTINGGSSSLKFALFERIDSLPRLLSGRVERIGMDVARWGVKWSDSGREEDREVVAADQKEAVRLLIEWVEQSIGFAGIEAIGHRIVHGGRRYHLPEIVTAELIEELRKTSPCDPDHLPGEIELIEAFRGYSPELTQVACFDTAFHHNMPRVAQIVAIPRRFEAVGVRRYGFHGLSYEYLMEELTRIASPDEARGRIILAHLGAGASLAAVHDHQSVDTTMGFTPASGLVMGTRTGDLDPGLVRFLQQSERMNADHFDSLVNHESGLLGVSETSSDVRDLLSRQHTDVRAAEAIDLFCYQVKKGIGAFAAVLGGLDTVVFAGGIGENSPEIRRRICEGLGFLGISLIESRNEANSPLISTDENHVKVRVICTNEELMLAKCVTRILGSNSIEAK
jgi:acetate kinase